MIGPVLHYWYGFNQAMISAPGLKGGIMRMAVDQVFFAPVFVAACFSTLFLLEVRKPADCTCPSLNHNCSHCWQVSADP